MPTIEVTFTPDTGFGNNGDRISFSIQSATVDTVDGRLILGGPRKQIRATVGSVVTLDVYPEQSYILSELRSGEQTAIQAFVTMPATAGDISSLIKAAMEIPFDTPTTVIAQAAGAAAEAWIEQYTEGVIDARVLEVGDGRYVLVDDLPDQIAEAIADDSTLAAASLLSARSSAGRATNHVAAVKHCSSAVAMSGIDPDGVGVTAVRVYRAACSVTNVRITMPGWLATPDGELPAPNAYQVKASLVLGSRVYPISFGAARVGTVQPWGQLTSDPLGVTLPRGTTFFLRVWVSAPGGSYLGGVSCGSASLADARCGWQVGDVVDSAAEPTVIEPTPLWGPCAITGDLLAAPAPQVYAQTDSIGTGDGDGPYGGGNWSWGGWVARAVADRAPLVRGTTGGDTLRSFGDHCSRRLPLSAGCTHAILAQGTNDWVEGADTPTLQLRLLAAARRLSARGMVVLVATVLPRLTGAGVLGDGTTDGYRTLANQTSRPTEGVRLALNAWLRGGAPVDPASGQPVATGTSGATTIGDEGHPITALLEVADAVESTRDSGKWKVPTRIVTTAAITTGQTVLTSSTAAFTAADVGAAVCVDGAGTSGARLYADIVSVTSSTTAILTTPAATTVSGATAGIDLWTKDGAHPARRGHVAMAAVLAAELPSMGITDLPVTSILPITLPYAS